MQRIDVRQMFSSLELMNIRDEINFDECVARLIVKYHGAENIDYLIKHSYKKIVEVSDIYENYFFVTLSFFVTDEDATHYKLKFG